MVEAHTEASALAAGLRDLHRALDELLAALPETRASMRTERDGWTVKHEIAYLAASHDLLVRVVEALPQASEEAPAVVAGGEAGLRRIRGEAMHAAQELRLGPLREHLATLAASAAAAVERHAAYLDRPVAIDGAPAPAADHLRAHLTRTVEGIERLRRVMG